MFQEPSDFTDADPSHTMTERDASPRRRHILASINREPPREPRHPEASTTAAAVPGPSEPDAKPDAAKPPADEGEAEAEDGSSHRRRRRRKLRLKDPKRARSRRDRDRSRDEDYDDDGRRRRRRRRRRTRSPTPPDPNEEPPLDPEVAFRESLFDAMADDEGAAYWEGVYGQPVHVYANESVGPQGELERMTDEEYAAYVRQKMWEKTHEGLIEERRRRDEARKEREEREKERRRVDREVERSLLAGEERRSKRARRARWAEYLKGWADWDGQPEGIPWPVESGGRKDVNADSIKMFLFGGLRGDGVGEEEFAKGLRDERVRWHPDKIQQRLGGEVEEGLMRDVTAIFQTIDTLWNDTRRKAS